MHGKKKHQNILSNVMLWQFMPVIVVYFICLVSVTQYLLRWQVMMYEDVSG